VNREERFDRLKFGNDFPINDNVRPKGFIKPNAIVHDVHRLLTVCSQPSLFQLVSHYYFVNRFEEPGTELRMNMKSRVQYLLCDFVFGHASAPSCPLWTLCELFVLRRVIERFLQIKFLQFLDQGRIVGGSDDFFVLQKIDKTPLRDHLRNLRIIAQGDDFWMLA